MDEQTFAAERGDDANKIVERYKEDLKNNSRTNLLSVIAATVKNKYYKWDHKQWIIKSVVYELKKDKRYKVEPFKNNLGAVIDYTINVNRNENEVSNKQEEASETQKTKELRKTISSNLRKLKSSITSFLI